MFSMQGVDKVGTLFRTAAVQSILLSKILFYEKGDIISQKW